MVDDNRVNKKRRKLQRKKTLSTDPLDWLNISSVSDVPRKDEWTYSDEPILNWKPTRDNTYWSRRWDQSPAALKDAQHVEPKGLSEIGFGGFWGDYRMDGSLASDQHKRGEDVQAKRVNVQRRMAKGYKEAGCNKCGQVIRVRIDKKDDSGGLLYTYDSLAWDMFPENAPTCKNCNTAMSYNYKLEKFRKGEFALNRHQRGRQSAIKSAPVAAIKSAPVTEVKEPEEQFGFGTTTVDREGRIGDTTHMFTLSGQDLAEAQKQTTAASSKKAKTSKRKPKNK